MKVVIIEEKVSEIMLVWNLRITFINPRIKVPIRELETFVRMKLWDVEHFTTDFDLRKRRDNKMGTYKTLQHETNNKISGKKRTNIF